MPREFLEEIMAVRANERGESSVEFLHTAHELEIFTLKAIHNEKIIPKRYRLTYGSKILEHAITINNCVRTGNKIYLNKQNYPKRAQCQRKAKYELELLIERLQVASEIFPIKDTVLETWTGLLLKEDKAIKNWIESDKKRIEKE